MLSTLRVLFTALCSLVCSLPCNDCSHLSSQQLSQLILTHDPGTNAETVANETRYAYQVYLKYAGGCDEVTPITLQCKNYAQESMQWTPVDTLDTLMLMGLDDLVNDTLSLLCKDGFSYRNIDAYITEFDAVIRVLGGLLSAYAISEQSYPYASECLLNRASELGDSLLPIWQHLSHSGFPYTMINLKTGEIDESTASSCPAVIGTSIIELGSLSAVTGDLRFYDAALQQLRLLNEYSTIGSPAGMVAGCAQLNNQSMDDVWCSRDTFIDAQIDSYYEYLIKGSILFENDELSSMWDDSYLKIINNLAQFKQESNDNPQLWFRDMDRSTLQTINTNYDLYSCFFAACLALDGRNMSQARMSQEANWAMWNVFDTVEPGRIDYQSMQAKGKYYDLNPESIESNYYLSVLMNDDPTLYFDRAQQYWSDIVKWCRCDANSNNHNNNNHRRESSSSMKSECQGYTGLNDVTLKDPTQDRSDSMPSFFFAETLKYLFLTFKHQETNGDFFTFDDWIFNTEAHPIPRKWGQKLVSLLDKREGKLNID